MQVQEKFSEIVQSNEYKAQSPSSKIKNNQHQYTHRRTYKGTTSNKLQSAKKNARYKNLEFDLDIDYVRSLWEKQQGKCALSGVTLGFIGAGWSAASLDRIDPAKGYIKGNVQWVCWRVNDAKSNMSSEDFITMCHAIAATSPYIIH